ncbi:MAG: type III pantothenate kinase [Deltaproteobacteria bacterium]|nr:type III pantothenate kinase [Deltaproteobacteria bacterium]MBW2219762.1 type III pantothenate kinase [Deltaproteobacteria bacterium]
MLLVIDIGNTNTVIGIFKKDNLVTNWRIRTERRTTGDEFSVLASGLFKGSGIQFKDIQRTIISCVVPPVVGVYDAFCRKYLNHAPEWIDAASSGIMPILYGNPSEVGADRIVNAVGAYYKYKKSLIIVDFGTATTFDAVSQNGEYLGGAISPGIMIASEALFANASKLPRVDLLTPPQKVIGKDTSASLKSGIVFGYAGLVDGIVKRMKTEMKTKPTVVATGGLSELIGQVSETIDAIEPDLTLQGLKIISSARSTR